MPASPDKDGRPGVTGGNSSGRLSPAIPLTPSIWDSEVSNNQALVPKAREQGHVRDYICFSICRNTSACFQANECSRTEEATHPLHTLATACTAHLSSQSVEHLMPPSKENLTSSQHKCSSTTRGHRSVSHLRLKVHRNGQLRVMGSEKVSDGLRCK